MRQYSDDRRCAHDASPGVSYFDYYMSVKSPKHRQRSRRKSSVHKHCPASWRLSFWSDLSVAILFDLDRQSEALLTFTGSMPANGTLYEDVGAERHCPYAANMKHLSDTRPRRLCLFVTMLSCWPGRVPSLYESLLICDPSFADRRRIQTL